MGSAGVRPIDPGRDLPAVAHMLVRARARGGLSHPGGIQWWLPLAGRRADFEAFVWQTESRLNGFALIDAAWSDSKPSSYGRELHDAVKRMPQFRPDLVTIALAPDGTVAACCIGWLDDASETLEIEPLGTHRDYRRLGLAHAVVKEVQHRAWANGAKHGLVWNPHALPASYGLYSDADIRPARTLGELTRTL